MRRSTAIRHGICVILLCAVANPITLTAQSREHAPQPPPNAIQPVPQDVLNALANAAASLVDNDAQSFMDTFDRDMPGYAQLRDEVEGLLGANDVSATIEVVNDQGDDRKHSLELDWLLVIASKDTISGKETRRQVLKCTIERRGKKWKITMLEPLDLFKS